MNEIRRFPAPWTVERVTGGYRILDTHQVVLFYVYGAEGSRLASMPKTLSLEEAEALARWLATTPEGAGTQPDHPMPWHSVQYPWGTQIEASNGRQLVSLYVEDDVAGWLSLDEVTRLARWVGQCLVATSSQLTHTTKPTAQIASGVQYP